MSARGLEVSVRDSVYEPGTTARTILYDESRKGRTRYKVWLYLEGPHLPYVKSVTYTLHRTFPNPVRTIARTPSNPTCALETWTWGLFDVPVEIEDKSGNRYQLVHSMSYSRDITGEAKYEVARVGG